MQSASFLLSTLNYFQGVLKASSCSSSWLILADVDGSAHGKCQFVVGTFSAHLKGLA